MHDILVDLHRLGGNKYNGLYHFCSQLGDQLLKAEAEDLHLHYYVPEHAKQILQGKVQYVTQKSRDKYYRFGTQKFDVWHVAATLSWYRPFNKKTKTVFTIHDLNFLDEQEYAPASKKRYLKLIVDRVKKADHLTFISRFAQQQAIKHLPIDGKPQTIIYNGSNISHAKAVAPDQLPSGPFLFSIGQLHSRKNFHVLPALLCDNDLHLIIAGLNQFSYRSTIMEEAKKHNVEKRVHLIGAVSEQEKQWYYENCAAFVFPSVGEGFGLPVLEAMQLGKPVFLAHAASLPEVGGDAAFYFHDFDAAAMRSVFECGMQRYQSDNMSGAIKQQAEKFNWMQSAEQYLDVYRSLL